MKYCLILFLLFIVGCQTTQHIRSETVRPGMSMQYLLDFTNNTPNCVMPKYRAEETNEYVVYKIRFIDGNGIVRPYRCTFSNGPTPASQILQSITYDRGQDVQEAEAIMKAAEMQRGAMQNMFRPYGR